MSTRKTTLFYALLIAVASLAVGMVIASRLDLSPRIVGADDGGAGGEPGAAERRHHALDLPRDREGADARRS